ncbi:MAG: nicotinate phosphoribosyltransferase, partial [Synechocystis sp.]|nr:nicotinate phosphoribosyltransferase [Synechocystis sp.]
LVMAIAALSGSEDEAFAAFQQYFPGAPLLIDTFDTVEAAQRLADRVNAGKMTVTGVRLDSGDLAQLSQQVRALLPEIKIFASGDLDEWAIADLQQRGASIDGYGLGTKLVTGNPVNGVYKLVEIDGQPTCKRSSQKATYPGKKQIFRRYDDQGQFQEDRLGLATEAPSSTETPLLTCVMAKGKRQYDPESLQTLRQRTRTSVQSLPLSLRQLSVDQTNPVEISPALQDLQQQVFAQSTH